MTGLLGFVCEGREAPQALAALRTMRELVRQRYTTDDEAFFNGVVCATRVAPTATRGPAQPASADGVHVWVDGEFYDGPGAAASAASEPLADPARALLDLYGRHDDWRFLADIDGVYGAVIHDSVRRQIHLLTDRCGLANFYWTLVAGRPAWTSTLAAFIELPGFAVIIDRRAAEELCTVGHPLGERTLFEGVQLLPPGTVVTWDADSSTTSSQRYWWWDRLVRRSDRIDRREAADELGRLLRRSVAARCRPGERVGVSLSGGLDSRAILAAAPQHDGPPPTATFGQPGCLDVQIARRVAAVRGSAHATIDITAENWLSPRIEAVWWTDGQFNLTNMHDVGGRDRFAELADIYLNGYGGDFVTGGMYLNDLESVGRFDRRHAAKWMSCEPEFIGDTKAYEALSSSDFWFLENRSRRLNNPGSRYRQTFLVDRKPFMANAVIEFVYSLPDEWRRRGRLYHQMLLQAFPEYYRGIPWQSTGIPIGWPRGAGRLSGYKRRLEVRLTGRAGVYGLRGRHPVGYTDYPTWLRVDPGQPFFDELLRDPEALYPAYADRDLALEQWGRVLDGEDKCKEVGRYLTLEIWLQQVFNGRFRPGGGEEPAARDDDPKG